MLPACLPLAALEQSDQTTLIAWVVLGAFAVIKAAESGFNIWRGMKKTPAAEEVFATKKELAEYARRTDSRLDAIDQEMTSGLRRLETTLSNEMGAVQRALGRLEGQINAASTSATAAALAAAKNTARS